MLFKKRGYFFTLDAVLGLTVLVIGVLIILAQYINIPPPVQVGLLSDDLLNSLSNTKINSLNNPYAGIGGELWDQGIITDGDNFLIQQIGEFYHTGQLDTAEKFIQNVSSNVMPSQFRFEVWIDGNRLYPQIPSSEHISSRDDTTLLLTSKKLTFGILNKTTSDLWGPYKAEVYVWQK